MNMTGEEFANALFDALDRGPFTRLRQLNAFQLQEQRKAETEAARKKNKPLRRTKTAPSRHAHRVKDGQE